jgi:alpha-D-xyloside xylohydrolase
VSGPVWRRERHGFDSVPLYVREGAVLPIGARDDRPDTDHLDGLTLVAFPGAPGTRELRVGDAVFTIETSEQEVHATGPDGGWSLRVGSTQQAASDGAAHVRLPASASAPVLPEPAVGAERA